MQKLENRFYGYQENILDTLKVRLSKRLFKYLLKFSGGGSKNIVVRTNDMISIEPILFDNYERHITHLFNTSAQLGYSDFFIDIGANIGLSSTLSAEYFDKIYAYEPNPLAFQMLTLNAKLSEYSDKFSLNNYGLGNKDSTLCLMIPKHNWGGAFVRDENNLYDDTLLASKDGFKEFNDSNYMSTDVQICNGSEVIKNIFASSDFSDKDNLSGVIKIDVEGMELVIFEEIAKALPNYVKTIIVFENLDPNFDIDSIQNLFKDREFELYSYNNLRNNDNVKESFILKTFKKIMRKNIINHKLVSIDKGDKVHGDLVLVLN